MFRAVRTTSSFSSFRIEQVEYTSLPPFRVSRTAFCRSWRWSDEVFLSSVSSNRPRFPGPTVPLPLQGASSSTRSKEKRSSSCRASMLSAVTRRTPCRSRLAFIRAIRAVFRSQAVIIARPSVRLAISMVFPPGAAAISSTLSPGCASSSRGGIMDERFWR